MLRNIARNPGVDRRIILKWIFERFDWGGGIDSIYLAEHRNR
jgi:hypothetical protein